MTQENKLSESQEWILREMSWLRREVLRQDELIAKLSLANRELAETATQAGVELFNKRKYDMALKIKTTVKRVME